MHQKVGEPPQSLANVTGRNGIRVVPHWLVGSIAKPSEDVVASYFLIGRQLIQRPGKTGHIGSKALQQGSSSLGADLELSISDFARQPISRISLPELFDLDHFTKRFDRFRQPSRQSSGCEEDHSDRLLVNPLEKLNDDVTFGGLKGLSVDNLNPLPVPEKGPRLQSGNDRFEGWSQYTTLPGLFRPATGHIDPHDPRSFHAGLTQQPA
jgi:hypothetical protein